MQLLARLLAADAVVFLSACYVRSTFPRISSAAGRLLAALPVVLVNCALPLVFDRLTEFVTRACYLLLLVWLTNFKVSGTTEAQDKTFLITVNFTFATAASSADSGVCRQTRAPLPPAAHAGPIFPCICATIHSSDSRCVNSGLGLYAVRCCKSTFHTTPVCRAVEGKIPKVKSNSRLDHSAGSTFTLAKKCALKLVLLLGIVYILSSYELPILVAEFGQGEHVAASGMPTVCYGCKCLGCSV